MGTVSTPQTPRLGIQGLEQKMTTIITANAVKVANLAEVVRAGYLRGPKIIRRYESELVEDLAGYCIDAPDEIPAGGMVERSAGVWGVYPSETVAR